MIPGTFFFTFDLHSQAMPVREKKKNVIYNLIFNILKNMYSFNVVISYFICLKDLWAQCII